MIKAHPINNSAVLKHIQTHHAITPLNTSQAIAWKENSSFNDFLSTVIMREKWLIDVIFIKRLDSGLPVVPFTHKEYLRLGNGYINYEI